MKHTVAKIKRTAKVWLLSMHQGLMQRMAYRLNFIFMAIGVLLQMLLVLVFMKIIFNFINNLSGWSYNQALLVVASYMLVEGLIWATCAYMAGITKNINQGTLDYLIVKPMDTQFLVSIWRGDPEDWMRVVTAMFIFFKAFSQIQIPIFALLINFAYYLILIFCAYLIIYSMAVFLRSISFWTIESGSLWIIMDNITRMSQYPTDIFFHKIIRLFFSIIIPLAFVATVPARILIHGPNLWLIISSIVVASIFFIGSRKFFYFGLKHYNSASS